MFFFIIFHYVSLHFIVFHYFSLFFIIFFIIFHYFSLFYVHDKIKTYSKAFCNLINYYNTAIAHGTLKESYMSSNALSISAMICSCFISTKFESQNCKKYVVLLILILLVMYRILWFLNAIYVDRSDVVDIIKEKIHLKEVVLT